MKRLIGLAAAVGVLWAAGCKSTTSQTSGGSIERPLAAEVTPKTSETPRGGIQQAAAVETTTVVTPAIWRTPATGGECSH